MENVYVHYPLNQEITAIGGHYVITKELRMPIAGREVLVTVGYGVMDTTCCGLGGCAYATVYGYIKDWKRERNDDGYDISRTESIGESSVKQQLTEQLLHQEAIQQVNYL